VDIDEQQFGVEISIEDGLKRKRIPEVLCSPKRTRKNSSPFPEDLKLWGDAVDELTKTNFASHEDISLAASAAGCPLSERHSNDPTQGSTRTEGSNPTMRRRVDENRNRNIAVIGAESVEDELQSNNPNYVIVRKEKPWPTRQ
jgi:hypothetical protein